MAKKRGGKKKENNFFSAVVILKGHGRFSTPGHVWTSHCASIVFKLKVFLDPDDPKEVTSVEIKTKYRFGQRAVGQDGGRFVKPYFSESEMEKLHERATRIAFRKAGERASGVTVPEEPPREATKGEVSELKRHQTNDCERCTQSRIPCNGVLEVLEGKFITIGNKKKYKARMKKMEKLKAQSVLTGKPPNNTCKVLYHQTSEEAAEKILSSQKMKRGSDGLLGSGIYFAASPEETQYKASQKGVILRCVVYLGKQKEVKEPGKHTFITLRKENYDSVHAISGDGFLPTGDEHVVYNWDQVLHVSRVD